MAIKAALYKHLRKIIEGRHVESYEEALQTAKNTNIDYLIYPTILHWEDRATEWSSKADKIELQIVVTDTKTNFEVSSVRIKSHSSWWTFGGDHPQDLLDKPISQFIDTLF